MAKRGTNRRRSGCPVSVSLEIFGDRWSLLLIRDMMVRGYKTFGEFLHSGEGIATNVLSERLRRLMEAGMVAAERDPEDGRSVLYRLTEKGIAFAPVLLELLLWAAKYEETGAPCAVMAHMEANRAAVLAETFRRWKERDPEPILPPFGKPAGSAVGPTKVSAIGPRKKAKKGSKR